MLSQLEELERQNRADSVMRNDSLARALADYFDRHGSPNERMRAHYILGRTYADMGEAPIALDCFYDAIGCADTTSSDCDYRTLIGLYAQMSAIFHQQNLPQDEIRATQQYIHYTALTGDTVNAIQYQAFLVKPYYIMGKKDTVLHIVRSVYQQLEERNYRPLPALGLGTAIYIYIERGQLAKAQRLLHKYEHETGLFDSLGNVSKGWESFYWIKGFYELKTQQTDSAEYYFRKAIQDATLYDDISTAYKGMLAVWQRKRDIDSIVLYSRLNEEALDSLHQRMQTDAIHQAASLYDYTRSQKQAEQEMQRRKAAWRWLWGISSLSLLSLCLGFFYYRKKQREKQKKISHLNHALILARSEHRRIERELKMIQAKDYDTLKAQKEENGQQLKQYITEIEKESLLLTGQKQEDNLDHFLNSQIVVVFGKKALLTKDHPIPNKAEWKVLIKQFSEDMPATFQFFKLKKLSELQIKICILLLMDYKEGVIVELAKSSSESVSVAKSRANERLFGEKGAKTLKFHLEKLVLSN